MKRLSAVLLFALICSAGHAQQLINCATNTACTNNGPPNTGTGDNLPTAGTKINANFLALPSALFSASTTGTGSLVFGTSPTLTNLTTNITGSTQCVHANSAGVLSGTGSDCGSGGGSSAFNALTSGTNTAAAMLVGTGASLGVTGSGTISATAVPVTGVTGLGTGISTWLATPSSANLAAALTDETGTGAAVFGTSPTLTTPNLGTPSAVTLTNATFPASISAITTLSGLTSANGSTVPAAAGTLAGTTGAFTVGHCLNVGSTAPFEVADAGGACGTGGATAFNAITSGTNAAAAMVVGTGASLTTSGSGTITATAAPVAGITGLGTGVGTWLATPSSANLAGALTDETGSGAAVFATSPTLVTPTLGAATATSINGNTFTTGTYTLTGSAGKTLNFTNSLTLSGTDATTMTFPSTTGTVTTLNSTQTFTAAKTFTNSDLVLLGSSTGATTFTSANAGASNFTATVPANTGTVAELNLAQTWSAAQTFSGGNTTVNVTGSTQCLHVNTSGVISGTGSDCGSGAVSSVSAGSSGSVSVSPTTGSVVVDLASQSANTVIANVSGSSGVPTATSLTSFQSALTAANAVLVSATAPTGPTNDYSPTGYGTTTAVLYLTPTAGGSTINGLVAGSAMQQVFIVNAEAAGGSDAILLKNQSSSDTTAANRFMATGDLVIPAGGGVQCLYFTSSINRWWCH